MTVSIDSTSLEMELDTGASRSIISEETYKNLQTHTELPPLQSTTTQHRTNTGLVSRVHPFQIISVPPNQYTII